MSKGRSASCALFGLGLPIANADEVDTVTINVDWTDAHAYIIAGNVGSSRSTSHTNTMSKCSMLESSTTGEDLRIILNTTVSNGDVVTIQAGDVTRTINVGLWGQPIADHEVTLNSEWTMDQQWENENGTQKYILLFDGQGWQQELK